MLRYFSWKLPVGDCYRYGANVGFCDATTDMMLAPSFEIESRCFCRNELTGRKKKRLQLHQTGRDEAAGLRPLRLGEEKKACPHS